MEKMAVVLLLAFVGIHQSTAYGHVGHNLQCELKSIEKHCEFLNPSDLTHRLAKRNVHQNSHPTHHFKELQLKTLDRDFLLELEPNIGILHSSFNAYEVDSNGNESPIMIDRQGFFHGNISGEGDSNVHAHFDHNGVMTATIRTKNKTHYIEPAWRHFKNNSRGKMIAYNVDVEHLSKNQPNISYGTSHGAQKPNHNEMFNRSKRAPLQEQLRPRTLRPHKTRCSLLLVADYRFHRAMGGGSSQCTANYLISLIDRINQIFLNTVWRDKPDEVGFDGMGFVIKKIIIHSEPTKTNNDELHYNMEKNNWEVRNLLGVFSRDPTHKEFCLAHLFTDIKFQDPNPGFAYVGSPRRNAVGGICSKEYLQNGHTFYVNSGLSSCRNRYGNLITTREATLVTAHQFGHNWGAEHDPEDLSECNTKGINGGSYLMQHSYVSGNEVNNERFSPCSLRSIRKVLLTKSEKCFLPAQEPICGNLRVEEGEECDAGLVGTDDLDECCRSDCTLRLGALCSDKNSPCCQSCQLLPAHQKCQQTDEEQQSAFIVESVFIGNMSENCSFPIAASTLHHSSSFASIIMGLVALIQF